MKSLNRLLAVTRKEVRQMRRDRLTFAMIVGIPSPIPGHAYRIASGDTWCTRSNRSPSANAFFIHFRTCR